MRVLYGWCVDDCSEEQNSDALVVAFSIELEGNVLTRQEQLLKRSASIDLRCRDWQCIVTSTSSNNKPTVSSTVLWAASVCVPRNGMKRWVQGMLKLFSEMKRADSRESFHRLMSALGRKSRRLLP